MPLAYEISIRDKRAGVTGRGKSDFSEFITTMKQVAGDPAFSPDFDIIADFRDLEYSPSLKEIRAFSSTFIEVRSSFLGRVGFVVEDKLQLRLGRFAAMLARLLRFEISVFEDFADASSWLDERKDRAMPDTKDKILELLSKPRLAGLATLTSNGKPWVRYVTVSAARDLTIRFATFAESRKATQIAANPEVHLTVGVESVTTAEHWVQVEGQARISADKSEREEFWSDELKAYFDGPDDPNYVVGIIVPERIEYMKMSSMKPEIWQRN